MVSRKHLELARECKRLSESCLYTSTSLFIWLRLRRCVKTVFIAVPLVLGSLASWEIFTSSDIESLRGFAGVAAFLAGLMPSIYAALKFDDQLDMTARGAAEFKNLQDRFRQAALVSSHKPFEDFERDAQDLMRRLEGVRADSLTPPEWCFRLAQKKIKTGDYEFDVDLEED